MRVPLQMVALVALLVLGRAVRAGCSRCLAEDKLKVKVDAFLMRSWKTEQQPTNNTTCAQAARESNQDIRFRAVAPWTYILNSDDRRRPIDIMESKCLCDGCILNHKENRAYNSVPVYVSKQVMMLDPCNNGTKQYRVKRTWIKVAVGCTCAVPMFSK